MYIDVSLSMSISLPISVSLSDLNPNLGLCLHFDGGTVNFSVLFTVSFRYLLGIQRDMLYRQLII